MPGVCLCHKEIDRFPSSSTAPKSEILGSKIKGAKIRTFNSAGEAFLELNNKGCEAIVNDKPVNEYFLTQKASANFNLREVPGVLKAENYGFAIRKGDDKLRARLDKALDEIRADGTYDKIYAKWFGGNK